MAEEQGNIKQEFTNAILGLNLDQTLNQIKQGTLTYALNAALENFDSNSVNYQNEPGNEFCVSFPEGFVLIGHHFIIEQNKHLFFLTDPLTRDCQLGYMDNNDCIYRVYIDDPCLGWDINFPIHKVVHRITNCNTEIFWPDNVARRYLDLDNIPRRPLIDSTLCDPSFADDLKVDCNKLLLQPNFTIPEIDVIDILNGGDLTSGTVQFAAQYSDASGNPFTSYYSITNPTPIANILLTTNNFNESVGKSVVVNVSNLDVTGQFQYFNLAVIKTVNNISSVELVGTYFIENYSRKITYTGQQQTSIKLSINDIFEKFPYYELADDITAVQDVLVWKGLTSIDRVNYQEIASQITLQWQTYKMPTNEDYSDELNATNLVSFLRDEIYPFEVVFLLNNGKQTDGFHIPGRAISFNEVSKEDILNTDPDFIEEGDSAPYWKIYNTASVSGDAVGENIGNAIPYKYGEFAYWESEEEYPCNSELWGDLAGKKIRHHKFPDISVAPIIESLQFTSEENMIIQRDFVFPIGVKINPEQIKSLINSSSLTQTQKDAIVGFKIIRGNRATNKSIVAKGMLRNVNKYEKENQTYYYPNYPYNDINEDPFLNSSNNAWSQLCEPFVVEVTELAISNTGGPDYVEIQYIDCNTNKTAKLKIYAVGNTDICSISKPSFTHGEGKVSFGNYEVWRIASTGTAIQACAGWKAQWIDKYDELRTEWVEGWPVNSDYTIQVKIGNSPICIDGCSHCGKTIQHLTDQDVTSSSNCKIVTPVSEPVGSADILTRQIFNSPETSFGQPFLGDILKIESLIYGRGKAHFVEVKDNAKYKLLTAEAQKDALDSSNSIGAITDPFNAVAMFTAYQAYLSIYINGITRKNYAYSYNTRASYDYTTPMPNEKGIKQRKLNVANYLIPTVQSVSEDSGILINNFQRESSVYLKTTEENPLPFPRDAISIASEGSIEVEDRSRITIGDSGACDKPQKEQDISVLSYYAAIKNIFPNQWGQIYSYDTVDTGYQCVFDSQSPKPTVVFGGDTYISRFAFKTKLPFFFDNRVGAPDDSDIFYDEIGNIAYPKYWHSSRSILEDYTANTSNLMRSIISYKAHNFDCPNVPVQGGGTASSFYDGLFYLFAYGIPSFYCESSYNTDLRQAFNNKEGDFWPHVSTSIPDDWLQESFVSIANDNTYTYNVTYSKQNKENTFTHLPPDYSGNACLTTYPFRAIYSDSQNTDADNRVNNWLIYRALSYFDFPQNYGALVALDGIQNRAILARFENKTLLYNSLLTLNTSYPQAAYLGNPSMFDNPPIDFAETDLGYVGSQNKFLLKIPQGQITVDAKRGQVFLTSGTSVNDISAFGTGLNRFFTDHLAFEILRYFPTVNTDNHFNGVGLHGVYDSKFDRVIISKLDYIPLSKDIKFDSVTKEFYVEEIKNTLVIRKVVYLQDTDYFCNKSWTLSYNMNTQAWISFHSYIPNFYIAENNFFYSGLNDCCTDFDFVAGGIIENTTTTTTSTSSTSSTTTTTTTEAPLDCLLAAEFILTDCALIGNGVVTVEPLPLPCTRPMGLNSFTLISGYTILSGPIDVDSTSTKDSACLARTTLLTVGGLAIIPVYINSVNLNLGTQVYINNGSTSCIGIPDGWYLTSTSLSDGVVLHVVGNIIVAVENCIVSTTTTTTALTTTTTTTVAPCFNYKASTSGPAVLVEWIDCLFAPQSQSVGGISGYDEIIFCATSITSTGGADISLIGTC